MQETKNQPARRVMPWLVAGILLGVAGQPVWAADPLGVVFKSGVSNSDVELFISDWASVGVRTVARVPERNRIVVVLPDDLVSADLGYDPLVKGVIAVRS